MKEYKVDRYKTRFTKNDEGLEDFLNSHAKAGWTVKQIDFSMMRVVLVREKNR